MNDFTKIAALAKAADVATPLRPHQQRVVERMRKQPGLVVAHGLGSGKTLTSLATAEDQGGATNVVVPAALQGNYRKEIDKHVVSPRADYNIQSLQGITRKGSVPKADLTIVDEAHRLRDPGSAGNDAIASSDTGKRMLLTGTPAYNHPFDLASLVNLAASDKVLPNSKTDFEKKYVKDKTVSPGFFARVFRGVRPGNIRELNNTDELGKILGKWVDFHENSTEGFPGREDKVVEATMSPEQKRVYDAVIDKAPSWVKYKVQQGLPPSKAESANLNAFLSAARQVSVSPHGFDTNMTPERAAEITPKIRKAYENLQSGMAANPNHRAVIYSNFLDSGIAPYEALLKKDNVPYGRFTGSEDRKSRDQLVRDYNEGKLKALLLSSAGGEGLDLKGTRQIQILEPHWNKEKLEQVIGRGIRFGSHAHLPEDQRKVLVEHYLSTMPEPGFFSRMLGGKRPSGTDEYLRMLSGQKDQFNQQVRDLLRAQMESYGAPAAEA